MCRGFRVYRFFFGCLGRAGREGVAGCGALGERLVLKGSWDLVTRVISIISIPITPLKVLITLLTKSHDPPSRSGSGVRRLRLCFRAFGLWG